MPLEPERTMLLNPSYENGMPPNRGIIEVRLRTISQLFDSLDPSPFREKDLDSRAEDYILESAREVPGTDGWSLYILLDEPPGAADEIATEDAIRAHFGRRSTSLRRKLRQLLRRGVISLGIGLTFLVVVFVIVQFIGRQLDGTRWASLFREGLLIVGWVAMWRPLEIFLYDWWPIVGERRLSDRLSVAPVRIVPSRVHESGSPVPGQNNSDINALARWENEGGRVLVADQVPLASVGGSRGVARLA
jgi:hypothetical protein